MKKFVLPGICVGAALLAGLPAAGQVPGAAQTTISSQDSRREHLEHGSTMHRLSMMTAAVAELTTKISSTLDGIPAEKMKAYAGLMQDISGQALDLSRVMGKGGATPEELMQLQNRTLQMQDRMAAIESAK